MDRRGFLGALGALVAVPYEPQRIYSFLTPRLVSYINAQEWIDAGNELTEAPMALSEGGLLYFPPGQYYLGNVLDMGSARVEMHGCDVKVAEGCCIQPGTAGGVLTYSRFWVDSGDDFRGWATQESKQ